MDETTTRYVLDGLTWYLVFIVSTSLHEAAHAWAALWGGDPTAHRAGQTTLNPVPHIRRAPVGMVVVPILSFIMTRGGWMMGWASAPYDPYWALRHPRRAALMSLAGPAANFLLAGIAFAAIKVGLGAGFFEQPASAGFSRVVTGEGFASGAATLVSVLLMLNVILGIFNLLPAPPLDGHAVVPLFLSRESGLRWLEGARGFGMMGIVLAWVVFGRIFGPIFSFVLELIYPGTSWG